MGSPPIPSPTDRVRGAWRDFENPVSLDVTFDRRLIRTTPPPVLDSLNTTACPEQTGIKIIKAESHNKSTPRTPPANKQMPLLALPNELLLLIASDLTTPSSISSFLQTNRRLYHLLSPLLRDAACQQPNAVTALFWAARTNNVPTVRHILLKGDSVLIVRRAAGVTARKIVLHETPGKFRDALLKTVMNGDAEISIMDKYTQETALHIAVKAQRTNFVKRLLDKGADTAAQDIGGWTALHMASRQGSLDVVKMLLEKGADPNIEGFFAETPLCLSGQHEDVARLLVENGANTAVQDGYGRTPLHLAARYWRPSLTRLVLEKGADIAVRDPDGRAVLHIAAIYNSRSLQVLLEKGADIAATDMFGRTPLHLAAKAGSAGAVKRLLDSGADVAATDHYGRTALHVAAWRENEAVVRVLLGGGADAKTRDSMDRTAFQVAMQKGGRGRWISSVLGSESGIVTSGAW